MMEFPDDILRLIREYSRPFFKHFKEYTHALKVLGMTKWKKLREKIHEEPERILPSLLLYQDAFVKKKEAYALRDAYDHKQSNQSESERWISKNEIYNWVFYAKRREEEIFWMFAKMIYGKDANYWEIKLDMQQY